MDGDEISRREILTGLAGVGGTGAAFGTGTAALLSDEEASFDNQFRSGTIDLAVEGEGATSDGNVATLAISLTPDSTSGSSTFTARLPDGDRANPAYVWVRSFCPEPPTELAEELDVALSYACSPGEQLFGGSLREFAEWLLGGHPLSPACEDRPAGGQGCLAPGEELPLRLEWALDEDYVGSESLDFQLEFFARQCRNTDGTSNPFPAPSVIECEKLTEHHAVSFVEIWSCDDADEGDEDDCNCTLRGKIELEDDYCGEDGISENYVEPGRTYTLYDDGDDCTDTGYQVRVTSTTTKTEGGETETTGIAFELLDADGNPGPNLCRVDVKGGSGTVTYDDPSDFDGNATNGELTAPEEDK